MRPTRIVAGLSLKNLWPRVWDRQSPSYLPALGEVMVSYAEFEASPAHRRRAVQHGLHESLGIPETVKVFLDNGAFQFSRRAVETDEEHYEQFVRDARPDWHPISQDFIPSPAMTRAEQMQCLARTMAINRRFSHDGFVPVIHVSQVIDEYIAEIRKDERLAGKPALALGGIVPNLLRAPSAMAYDQVLGSLRQVRAVFPDKALHVFGIGGTATLHLAALMGIDTVDSSGWRNRAARGIVQLPGCGDRMVIKLGSWRGRSPSADEWTRLANCQCPACQADGKEGLRAEGKSGFCNRATHNLWVLLEEARWIWERLLKGTYLSEFRARLDNSIYLPLIEQAAELVKGKPAPEIPLAARPGRAPDPRSQPPRSP
jgi:queuine/archaeosine tRNA-ribosyltransferase